MPKSRLERVVSLSATQGRETACWFGRGEGGSSVAPHPLRLKPGPRDLKQECEGLDHICSSPGKHTLVLLLSGSRNFGGSSGVPAVSIADFLGLELHLKLRRPPSSGKSTVGASLGKLYHKNAMWIFHILSPLCHPVLDHQVWLNLPHSLDKALENTI